MTALSGRHVPAQGDPANAAYSGFYAAIFELFLEFVHDDVLDFTLDVGNELAQ